MNDQLDWDLDPDINDFDDVVGVPWQIKVSGIFAFAPIWGLVLGFALLFTGVEPISRLGLGLVVFAAGARVAVGLVFTIRVLQTRHYTSGERLLWVAGLLFLFPIATIPFYWHREIWQAFQAERFSRI